MKTSFRIPPVAAYLTMAALPRSTIHSRGACQPDHVNGRNGPDARGSEPQDSSRASDWIGEITKAWSRAGAHTMELARVMVAARNRLRYGEWSKLWRTGRMPFARRKGEMLVVIGDRLGGIDAQYIAHLPASWSVLYELARLHWAVVQALIDEGAIHPRLTVQEAKALVARFCGRSEKKTARGSNVQRRLQRFRDFVERTLDQWTPEERQMAKRALRRLIEEIDASDGDAPGRLHDDGRANHPSGQRIFPDAPRVVTSLTPETRKTV